MIRKSIILTSLLFCATGSVFTQKPWSLEDCIQYAMENNIQIKQSVLNTEYNENLLKQSRLGQIPNLNANSNYTYSWGRALDQTTYQFTEDQKINSISAGVTSSMNLFNGFQVRNTILQNELDLMASYEEVEKIRNDISLNIAAAYLAIMFNQELLAVARSQLEITGQQVERTRKMVDAGSLARGSFLEIQAQYAAEELNLVNAENQLEISLLRLQQILDLPVDSAFDVAVPELPDPENEEVLINVGEVYRIAEQTMPEVKGAQLNVQSSERGLKIAESGRYPRLYISANYNTGYSDIRQKVVDISEIPNPEIGTTQGGEAVYSNYPQSIPIYGTYPFFEQIRDNTSAGLGMGLSIPIFNGWQVNTNVANARIVLENAQLELQSRKNALYATIQQSYADAVAALKKFTASEHALISMEESFKYTEKKFEVGLVNTVDYNTSKNQLTATQSDLLQAKYDFIFKTKILNFYKGEPITL
ncbi:MAG TPA: TolC family protein [Bacteroides sp.]|nr:TolC family protein [Bacteroides sp.]